jgi:hypothetical protein
MEQTIGIGETISIPPRVVTEEMHDRRVALGLAPKNEIKNGTMAKILRAYPRPRGQEMIEIEEIKIDGEIKEIKVVGMAKGYALADVIDEMSEPYGVDYEIYVVRDASQPEVEVLNHGDIAALVLSDDLIEEGLRRGPTGRREAGAL